MKKILKRTLATVLVVLMLLTSAPLQGFVELEWPELSLPSVGQWFSGKASAKEIPNSGKIGDNCTYVYDGQTGELIISGKGEMYGYFNNLSPFCFSDVKSIIIEEGITSIGSALFKGCKELTKVSIPNSVSAINYDAFENCTALTSIIIPYGVKTIGNGCFWGCKNLVDVYLPNSLESVGSSAFRQCSSIVDIEIPDSVTNIGVLVFCDCKSLKTANIGNSLEFINEETFSNCFKLESVIMGDSVKRIGYRAFEYCEKLSNVKLSNTLELIEDDAFYDCISLKELKVPASVTAIYGSYYNTYPRYIVDENNQTYSSDEMGILFDKDKTIIYKCPVYSACEKYIVPESVTEIDEKAFYGAKIDTVILPKTVQKIGRYAFYSPYVNNLHILNEAASIGAYLLRNASSIIYGYPESTAERYAHDWGYNFKSIDLSFSKNEYKLYTAQNDGDIKLTYKPLGGNVSSFKISDLELNINDTSIVELKTVKLINKAGYVDVAIDILPKNIGNTILTAKYKDGSEVSCTITVKQPNELKFSIAEPVNYYEAGRVFFDESGTITSGAIKIPFKLENNFVKDVEYLINNPDALKALKYKNIRVSFEIEGSDVLSFSSSEMLNKIDYHLESLDFKDNVEDLLYLYSYNSDGFSKNETENIKLKYNIYFDGPSDSESKNYNPENEETREIKLKNETAFTLQSYLNKYITEVVSAPSTYGYYKRLMDYSVAQDMKSLENTGDYKWAEVMSKGLVDNAVSLFTDFNEINGYEIVLADMLSILNSQNEAEQTQMFGGAVFDFSSSFFDALNGFFGEKYVNSLFSKLSGKDAKLTIDAITEVVAGKTTSGVAYELVTELMKDSRFVRFLDNTVFICDVANKALTAYGVVKDTVGGLQKALAVHSAYAAYEQSIKNNKYVFSRLRTAAENSGNDALAKAIYNYMNYEDSKISEKIANVIAETVVNGGGSGVQVGLIALANALAEGVAEKVFYVLGAVVAGFDCGRLLSNVLCNTSDYAAAAGSVVAAGYISESLKEAIFDIQSDVANDPGLLRSFEKAQQLDSALNMYRVIEEISYDKTIEAIEAEGTSKAGALVRRLSKKRQETYEETIATMLSGKKSLDNLKTHDEKLEEIYSKVLELGYNWKPIGNEDVFNTAFKTLCVQCPVDVFVRNSKGEIVASVENNTVTKENGGIDIIVIEDEKFICLPSTEEYDIEVIATDEGTMDYTVFEYGSDSLSNIRSVSYEKIPLVKNKEFTAKLDTAKYTDKNNYNLSAGTETITATKDDYVPVTSVSLDGDADTVYAGSEITLSVVTDPENASPASFIWKSSDESVAAVSGGVVRGVKAGNAVITCELKSDSSIRASFEVTVTECSHSYSAWETVEESTCSEYGCKKRVCSVCNAVETEKITELKPHEAESESYELPASCEKNAATVTLCKNCGEICQRAEKQGTATGHKLSAVAVDKKATTENSGSQSQKCSTCGERVNVTKIPRVIKPYLSQTSFVFDGKVKNPALMVYDYDGNKLAINTDYRLTVDSGRVKPGTYKVVVSFIGKYEGTEKLSFTIAMKKTTVKATQNTTAIRLDWSAVPGAAGYRVFYKTAAGWKALCTTNKLTATFNKLPAGTKYTFAVMAGAIVDGKVIWADNYTVIETATQTLAPKKIAAAQNTSAIKLSWTACPGATGYRIFYKSGNSWKICLNATTATSHTFTNLKAGTKFTFAVRPYIITDSGVIWSDYTTYTASTLPAIPKTAVASPSSGKITVKWNAVSGAEAYQLYYKTGNGAYKLYKNYFSVQTVSFSGLKSGTKYTFAVRAAKNTSGGWVFGSFTPVSVTVK